jgi:adenine C2-methylase RlmN of 23S rRNA A2503 and tRNA A37
MLPNETSGDAPVRATTLLALTPAETVARFVELGLKPFHARIARKEVLERGITDYARMTALPLAARERLSAELPILSSTEVERHKAWDGTTKLLLSFPGGARPATVETVHPPRELASGKGATLCVSTQVRTPWRAVLHP